ncbi:flagellar biosynthesis protein FlhA [Alphaproteobacteria bacterium]|mgnify:FL=1|jgi:flagellar biosynthesis protein FlhA|nr:flagellar biosynthesis protein FlhA [Alphaproteobacteria bacterium]MDC1035310.1 flagellar biosynthesis protein FlhA [Alphaproteobacteria bacterium]
MNLTNTLGGPISLPEKIKPFGLPVAILMLMVMMVIPLPSFLLDIFFTTNILLSLLILMVSIHTFRPLDFSSFPTVLLFATILRLGLNVASTRIVLSAGHTGPDAAGKVIEAFGEFVIAGNYVVGIFVFAILIIINLVVITKGAGRVSEVSARFTLDAMPGKQMAIDADLNAGLLTSEEAKQRREDIAKEADFYGSMDGASKFVKGDAIAGILILLINIIGGLIIGIAQHNLPVSTAAENYIILSVGDGLVAQIPSLLLAIATAIIVTRVSTSQDLSKQIGSQIGVKQAWLPSACVLFLLGLIPGMPNTLFLLGSGLTFFVWWMLRKKSEELDEDIRISDENNDIEDVKDENSISLSEIADNSAISMQLGYGLIQLVDDENEGPLIARITGVRKQISKELGFVIPQVRIRDDLTLEANHYRIRIGQEIVAEDKIFPQLLLAIPGDSAQTKIEGTDVKDPSFNMDATWIEPHQQARAENLGYMVVEPEAVIATHLNQILSKQASELLGQDDVQALLDNLSKTSPQLVSSAVPKLIPLNILTSILKSLLAEKMPISDLKRILEVLASQNIKNMSPIELAEAVRPTISGLLIQQIAPLNSPLPIITFSAELEQMIVNIAKQTGANGLILEANLIQKIVTAINNVIEKLQSENRKAVMITAPVIRRDLSHMLRQHIPTLDVLSFTELPDNKKIEVVANIGSEEQNKD